MRWMDERVVTGQLKEIDQWNAVERKARREEIGWARPKGLYEIVPLQEWQGCKGETVGLDLGGPRQVCGSNTQENSIQFVCKKIQDEEAR